MPGPISDSYDPEFGTGENADAVANAIREVKQRITDIIGSDQLKNIVSVVQGQKGQSFTAIFTERELRIIRFSFNRALESI